MTARSGPWREEPATLVACGPVGPVYSRLWIVRRADTGAVVRTASGRMRTWRRRAHAYAHAEILNRQERDKQTEALKELGL